MYRLEKAGENMIKFLHSGTYQDYAKECFELSRDDEEKQTETVEKAWLSDVANYISKLENFVRFEICERKKLVEELSEKERIILIYREYNEQSKASDLSS